MPHLTRSQRDQLQALDRAGQTQSAIADILGCSQSSISRELQRNDSPGHTRYTATTAQDRAALRRRQTYALRPRWYDDAALHAHVDAELRDGKSPDQIAGRLRQQEQAHIVSHQSIYTYVARDAAAGGTLHACLRYRGKKHKFRGYSREDRMGIPDRHGIEERPASVDRKERSGDWESDLVMSGATGQGAVATFAERTCMYFRAVLVADKSADEMVRATRRALGGLPPPLRRTMTHDNGREISGHARITAALGTAVYCARPYRSSDRGLNEFMNRELRRFFPKGTDFSAVRQAEIDAATAWLNIVRVAPFSTARRTKPSKNSSTLCVSRFNVRP